ncbi:MAG: hypothetical protein PHQ74_00795 [Crocinitomicaceae bacterium]|nr:hypothetical protein [Crocinitomicaceae bacterium]
MNSAEIKIDLINRITQIKETRLIAEIQNLLDFELNKGVFEISDIQKNRLIEAKKDTVIPEKEANNSIEEWLQKK